MKRHAILVLFLFGLYHVRLHAQIKNFKGASEVKFIARKDGDLFGKKHCFIKNIGQYGISIPKYEEMGEILYGYEGWKMPVLFTRKGLVFLQRVVKSRKHSETESTDKGLKEDKERFKGIREYEDEQKDIEVRDFLVTMQWVNSNPNVTITAEDPAPAYHTYGTLPGMAKAYNKITCHDLYPGIDVVYFFNQSSEPGFEYSIINRSGANLRSIERLYGGDIQAITKNKAGDLLIRTEAGQMTESAPVGYYNNDDSKKMSLKTTINHKAVAFDVPDQYIGNGTLIIDPFITGSNTLTGANQGKAKDVDFDYAGNVYITGGGDFISINKLAKYDGGGNLLWTFSGTIVNPDWKFGANFGGWAVDKRSGKLYLGQGVGSVAYNGYPIGFKIIRLDASGMYDNFITNPNPSFFENWKMVWHYNNGSPRLVIGGGGTTGPLQLGILTPPSNNVAAYDITWGNAYQEDIADLVVDTTSNEIYCIFGSAGYNPVRRIKPPYSPGDVTWLTDSWPQNLTEAYNRPYMFDGIGSNTSEHSMNLFAMNASYLFYWDGKFLKAFRRSDGSLVGTPYILVANKPKWQGGIYATECNTVFIGDQKGLIRVLKFDGTTFNDDLVPDITLPGYSDRSVYDIACDPNTNLLYASGDGFVASIDISAYITTVTFMVPVSVNCSDLSATASVSPASSPMDVIYYSLYNDNVLVVTNTTGIFTGLNPLFNYKIKASSALYCNSQISQSFSLKGPDLSLSKNDACPLSPGKVTVTGIGGAEPYSFSLDGANFQTSNIFTGLTPGQYTITIRDVNKCINTSNVLINPCLSGTVTKYNPGCGNNDGSINVEATGGSPPYSYSLNGGTFQPGSQFNNLASGSYHVLIKDSLQFITSIQVNLSTENILQFQTQVSPSNCSGTGLINVSANNGSQPFSYSINGGPFQSTPIFSNLPAGDFQVNVKDGSGCISGKTVTVPLVNNLFLEAGQDQEICEGSSIYLHASTNAQTLKWNPAMGMTNNQSADPLVTPAGTTRYFLDGSLGACAARDSVLVVVNPAPIANAGADVDICYGQDVQLTGSGGTAYQWRPSVYLTDPGISNPDVVNPASTMSYYLKVRGINNCESLKEDTVIVKVTPIIVFSGNDTSVLSGHPIQLHAISSTNNASVSYSWSPTLGLDNPFIANPVAVINADMNYVVTVMTADGCLGSDSVFIKVYKSAGIYVPSAFSPNGDGKNDLFRVKNFGNLRNFEFAVFNRWGQMVFHTTDPKKSWDGSFAGQLQGTNVFVWQCTYQLEGEPSRTDRGSVLLIR